MRLWSKGNQRTRRDGAGQSVESLEPRTLLAVNFPADGQFPIQDSGGPVLTNPRLIALYLGTQWTTNPALALERQQIDGFLQYLPAAPYVQALEEYRVRSASFLGSVVDPVLLGWSGTQFDGAVQNEINGFIRLTLQTRSPADAYIVFAPPGTSISRGADADFPAYHDAFVNGWGVATPYAIVTHNISPAAVPQAQSVLDVVTALASHEIAEMYTDPFYAFGRTAWAQLPQGANDGEIADTAVPGHAALTGRVDGYLLSAYWSNVLGIPWVPGTIPPGMTLAASTTLKSSAPTSSLGSPVAFTARVAGSDARFTPTGTVRFSAIRAMGSDLNSGLGAPVNLGQVALGPDGTARVTTSALQAGEYNVTFYYSGDNQYGAARAEPIRQVVRSAAVPASPTDLSAAAVSASMIKLSWRAHSTDETQFVVHRSTSSSFTTFKKFIVPARTYTFTDTGLAANTRYYYRVYALNTAGASKSYSNVSTAVTLAATGVRPGTVTGLSALATSAGHVLLRWQATSTNESGFILQRSTTSDFSSFVRVRLPPHAYQYVDATVKAGTKYYYRIYAYNSAGSSQYYSNKASVVAR